MFGGKKASSTKPTPTPTQPKSTNSATIINSGMTISGKLEGNDSVHIDGKVIGDIVVKNSIIIGKSGIVEGNVKANNIIINGELKGTIQCEIVEVMKTGKVSHKIQAKHITLDGTIEGEIIALESINVLENSVIEAKKMESKKITVHGKINGNVIATEILEIGSKGFVEGQITVKNIKTEEGGRMIGTMSTYQEMSTPKSVRKTNSSSPKSEDDDFFKSK